MKRVAQILLAVCSLALLLSGSARRADAAPISLTAAGYTENFDGMGAPNVGELVNVPEGWTVGRVAAATGEAITGTQAQTSYGNEGSGSAEAGQGIFNFGLDEEDDRALGMEASSNPAPGGAGRAMQLELRNDTGNPLTGLSIAYDGEQWRMAGGFFGGGGQPQSLTMHFSLDGTSFIPLPGSLNFTSPTLDGEARPLDGNDPANRVADLGLGAHTALPAPVPAGNTFFLRWFDSNDFGQDHGLAVDNLRLSPNEIIVDPDFGLPAPQSQDFEGLALGARNLARTTGGTNMAFSSTGNAGATGVRDATSEFPNTPVPITIPGNRQFIMHNALNNFRSDAIDVRGLGPVNVEWDFRAFENSANSDFEFADQIRFFLEGSSDGFLFSPIAGLEIVLRGNDADGNPNPLGDQLKALELPGEAFTNFSFEEVEFNGALRFVMAYENVGDGSVTTSEYYILDNLRFEPVLIPEPGALALAACGLAGLGGLVRRRGASARRTGS